MPHKKRGRPKGLRFPHGYKHHKKHKVHNRRGRPSLGLKYVGTYLGNVLYIRR